MKKIYLFISISLMVILSGCVKSEQAAEPVTTESSQAEAVEAWGEVEAKTVKEINIAFPAQVQKIYVREGDEVKEGDKLASLDYEEYKQTIAIKEKEKSLDGASLDSLLKDGDGQSAEVSALQSEASLIQSQLKNGSDPEVLALEADIKDLDEKIKESEKDYEAKTQLLAIGGASQKELDDIKLKLDADKREKDILKIKIKKLNQDKQLKLKALNASITSKQAELNTIDKNNASNKSSTQIKQEIASLEAYNMKQKYDKSYIKGSDVVLDIKRGIVESINVVEGSILGEEQTTLMRIIDEDSIVVTANVPEEFIKDVKIGAKVHIIPYADKSAVIQGQVTKIAKRAVEVNGETVIKVEIKAQEQSPFLCDGYSVDVEIEIE